MDAKKRIWSILSVVAIIFTLFLATSCSEHSNFEQPQAPNQHQVMYGVDMDPYQAQTFEVTDDAYTEEERQTAFEEQQQRKEQLDEYYARTEAWNRNEKTLQDEEQRLEAYCNDVGYLVCNNLKYTCLKEEKCNFVKLECEDAGFDKDRLFRTQSQKYECNNWDVTVEDDTFWFHELEDTDFSEYGLEE